MALSEQIGQKEPVFVICVKPKAEMPDFATAMANPVESLDIFAVDAVNSSYCSLIFTKGAHYMDLSSLTIYVFSRPDAGMLPIRSAPVDRC